MQTTTSCESALETSNAREIDPKGLTSVFNKREITYPLQTGQRVETGETTRPF